MSAIPTKPNEFGGARRPLAGELDALEREEPLANGLRLHVYYIDGEHGGVKSKHPRTKASGVGRTSYATSLPAMSPSTSDGSA